MLKKAYYGALSNIRHLHQNRKALPETNPIIIYSMRKVGSTTLTSTLRSAGYFAYKHHCINTNLNDELSLALSRTGFNSQHWLTDGANFRKRLIKWRAQRGNFNPENRLRIFTFVKDPLAIAYSDYFMQLFEFMPAYAKSRGLDNEPSLRDHFQTVLQASLNGNAKDPVTDYLGKLAAMPNFWFEHELKMTTGIDVLVEPFSIKQGYGVYHGHDSDVVLIRTDRLSEVALDAIAALTEIKPAKLALRNVRATTAHGELYQGSLKTMCLPRPLVQEFYCQPWLNHFYSEIESENMIAKWSCST